MSIGAVELKVGDSPTTFLRLDESISMSGSPGVLIEIGMVEYKRRSLPPSLKKHQFFSALPGLRLSPTGG